MIDAAPAGMLRLTLARACAWGLLIAGWIGIGSLALQFAPAVGNGVGVGFALVALWLLALGAAAAVSTRGGMRPWVRALALCAAAAITGFGLLETGRGRIACPARGLFVGCVDRPCLGSGAHAAVGQSAVPAPPIGAPCSLGAGLLLGDRRSVGQCGLQHSSARPWSW
jgi:hypothetical protein